MSRVLFTIKITVWKAVVIALAFLAILLYLGRYTVQRIAFGEQFTSFYNGFYTVQEVQQWLPGLESAGIEYEIRPVEGGKEGELSLCMKIKDTDRAQVIINQWFVDDQVRKGNPPPMLTVDISETRG